MKIIGSSWCTANVPLIWRVYNYIVRQTGKKKLLEIDQWQLHALSAAVDRIGGGGAVMHLHSVLMQVHDGTSQQPA